MSTLIIEKAKLKNLKDLICLLFDDDLGKDRENMSETSYNNCLLYTSPSPRDKRQSRMPSSA